MEMTLRSFQPMVTTRGMPNSSSSEPIRHLHRKLLGSLPEIDSGNLPLLLGKGNKALPVAAKLATLLEEQAAKVAEDMAATAWAVPGEAA